MSLPPPSSLDALVVGAGFGGLHMLWRLREAGFTVAAIETGKDVGGTWYWNRYPGARCDVESVAYSYSFSPELDAEWTWSERYAAQPEILDYLRFAADRLDLRRDIRFETRLTHARFDRTRGHWQLVFGNGETVTARYLVMATGPLSVGRIPHIEGLDTFAGQVLRTSEWPEEAVSLTGKNVGVIGTGSSGTQFVPIAAGSAKSVTVFQRTPNFTVPARNCPIDEKTREKWNSDRTEIRAAMWRGEVAGAGDVFIPEDLRLTRMSPASDFDREQRRLILERRWEVGGAVLQGAFRDVMTDEAVNEEVAGFVRSKIRSAVRDPVVADKLSPTTYYLGTKRLCVGTDYYETFNRANVELVDVTATPIRRITAEGVQLDDRTIPLDILVFATGFDALTGALTSIDIRGDGNRSIADLWAEGAATYLGLMIAGFPNLFLIGGVGSPSVMSNVVMTNEYHVDFIGDLLERLRERGNAMIEAEPEAQAAWMDHVNEVGQRGLFAKANSWYMGANIPGKPRQILPYAGGVVAYRTKCESVREAGYAGFAITTPELRR